MSAPNTPDQDAARAELEKRMQSERCRYWSPNGRIEEFLNGIGARFPVEAYLKRGRIVIAILRAGNGIGKAQPKHLMIHTPDGLRRWGDIRPGETVFGRNGMPTRVLAVHDRGAMQTYRVTMTDGSSTLVCGDHLWTVRGRAERRPDRSGGKSSGWITLSTEELLRRGVFWKNNKLRPRQWELPRSGAVAFPEKKPALHPYVLGVWLGDGGRGNATITTADMEIIERLGELGYKNNFSTTPGRAMEVRVAGLRAALDALGLRWKYSYEKTVPRDYMENSERVRAEVLRGLLDTDGTANKSGTVTFSSSSRLLADDVIWLARSLGGRATLHAAVKKPFYRDKNGEKVICRDSYTATVTMPHGFRCFYVSRKQARVRNVEERYLKRFIWSIEKAAAYDCSCITVENEDGLYLTNDFIVTHNSVLGVNLAGYLSDNYPNDYLDAVPYLRYFHRPNQGRILTTPKAAQKNYEPEFKKWLRDGRYEAAQLGRPFNSRYRFKNGSEFDIFTFDQDPSAGESVTLRWAIIDEPMSHRHWTALKSRFRFGGIIFMLLTPLEGAGWYHDEFETIERLKDDVFVMEGSSEANCLEHGVRGILPHAAMVDMWRDFDEAELPARRDGKYLEHAGAIYKNYRDDATGHVMPKLEGYYAECWRRGLYTLWQTIDPHDRKPWAIEWRAFFPNGKGVAVCEWPDESMRPFHKIKSWGWGYDAYAKLTVETEKALGAGKPAHSTIMDPNYGPSAAMNEKGVTSIGHEFQAAYRRLKGKRRMIFPGDAITPGHLAVKGKLGDPAKGITPDYYWMEHCLNGRFAMTHYGYKENRDEQKGLSEVPVLQFKDFADLPRYTAMAKARYIEEFEDAGKMISYPASQKGNGYRGAPI